MTSSTKDLRELYAQYLSSDPARRHAGPADREAAFRDWLSEKKAVSGALPEFAILPRWDRKWTVFLGWILFLAVAIPGFLYPLPLAEVALPFLLIIGIAVLVEVVGMPGTGLLKWMMIPVTGALAIYGYALPMIQNGFDHPMLMETAWIAMGVVAIAALILIPIGGAPVLVFAEESPGKYLGNLYDRWQLEDSGHGYQSRKCQEAEFQNWLKVTGHAWEGMPGFRIAPGFLMILWRLVLLAAGACLIFLIALEVTALEVETLASDPWGAVAPVLLGQLLLLLLVAGFALKARDGVFPVDAPSSTPAPEPPAEDKPAPKAEPAPAAVDKDPGAPKTIGTPDVPPASSEIPSGAVPASAAIPAAAAIATMPAPEEEKVTPEDQPESSLVLDLPEESAAEPTPEPEPEAPAPVTSELELPEEKSEPVEEEDSLSPLWENPVPSLGAALPLTRPVGEESEKPAWKPSEPASGPLKPIIQDEPEEEAPVAEEPVIEEEAPVAEEPIIEEEAPVVEKPVIEEEAPVAEEPVIEEEAPVAEEPVIEEEAPAPVAPVVAAPPAPPAPPKPPLPAPTPSPVVAPAAEAPTPPAPVAPASPAPAVPQPGLDRLKISNAKPGAPVRPGAPVVPKPRKPVSSSSASPRKKPATPFGFKKPGASGS